MFHEQLNITISPATYSSDVMAYAVGINHLAKLHVDGDAQSLILHNNIGEIRIQLVRDIKLLIFPLYVRGQIHDSSVQCLKQYSGEGVQVVALKAVFWSGLSNLCIGSKFFFCQRRVRSDFDCLFGKLLCSLLDV